MKTTEILQILRVYLNNKKESYGIISIMLFGSYARNEQNKDSDVDLLIKLDKPSIIRINRIKFELEDILQTKVDIISSTSRFIPSIQKNIAKEAVYV